MIEEPDKSPIKYDVGVALSGGGARGFAHLGILRALDELKIRPGIIAGVSAGSLAGVLYCAGYNSAQILEMFKDLSFSDFAELSVPKDGFFRLDRLKKFLKKALPVTKIEDLETPIIICATDLDNGKSVAFQNGSIVDRVVASCSIPIVFKPVKIDGINYVDGGVLRNLPAWAIRNQCKTLIGVNVSPMVDRTHKDTLIDIAQRSYELMSKNNAVMDMKMCDILIQTKNIARARTFQIKSLYDLEKSGYLIGMQVLKQYDSLLNNK